MPSLIEAGLQSSKAIEDNIPLNTTNYANVDSVAVGGTANVRVYGTSGPGTQYPSVKGAQETIQPSATIINIPLGSNRVVAFDGSNYQVENTLPEVLADGNVPTGYVSVVEAGTVSLPTVTLNVTGGHITSAEITSYGSGLTQNPTWTITDASGTGATMISSGVEAGSITGVQITNSGSGYSATPTATAAGGVFSGASGGGTAIGGNGGRLIHNDGTTGGS